MKIEGYDFEITEFDSEGEAYTALEIARAEDKSIMGGQVRHLPQQELGKCVVWLHTPAEEYYL